jgi:glycosyltransferase involved in cell wall biosynthesis
MKISIITTVYNIEKYISKCIESLLAQTYKDIEIIIVDDCGNDGSMEIVSRYDDERIKIIKHSENMGAGWARRHGIEAATGDYIITIDGDDWISPTFIEDLVNNAKETNADIVSGGITVVYSEEYEEIKRFLPMISTGYKKI